MSGLIARALAGLLGVALFVVPGWAIASFVPALRRTSCLIRLGYAYLLGVVFVAGSGYAASHALGWRLRRGLFLPLSLLPIVAFVLLRRRPAPAVRGPRSRVLEGFAFFVATFVTVGLVAEALTNPIIDNDGRMTWELQMRHLREERTVDLRVLREPQWAISHPRYPLLIAIAELAIRDVFDVGVLREDDRVARPMLAAFYPAFLLVLFDQARRRSGRRAAALATLVASALPYLSVVQGGAASGYRDLPLACFWGAGALLLISRRTRTPEALAAGLLLAAAVLTKNEGLPLSGITIGVAALSRTRGVARALQARRADRLRARVAPLATALLLVAASAALLISWRNGIPNRYDEMYEKRLSISAAAHGLEARSQAMARAAFREASSFSDWGLFFAAAPLLALGVVRSRRREVAGLLVLALILAAGFYVTAYATSPWDDAVETLVRVTFSRFVLQLSMPLLVVVAMGIRAGLGERVLTPGSASG